MSNTWDSLISAWRNARRRTAAPRGAIRPQLEQLEKREVPSADVAGPPSISTSQLYQQLLQAEASPTASQAPFLQQSLTAAALVLPSYSSFLNAASNGMSSALGPQLGQQYMQMGLQQIDMFLLNLEGATLSALNAAGTYPNPTFLSDVAVLNAFMNDPLNYTPPS